jgi:hypothetical protein
MKPWTIKFIFIAGLMIFLASVAIQVERAMSELFAAKRPVQAIIGGEVPVISVDFARETSAISDQIFGEGVEMPFLDNIWDTNGGFDQTTLNVAKAIKFTNLRFGGATCRTYNWKDEAMTGYRPYVKVYWEGIDQWYEYAKLLGLPSPTICTNIHLSPGTSADWVRYANLEKNYNIINWEMGNEEYLAYTDVADYLRDAKAHCGAMKAVDPKIKCGIVGDEKGVSWTNAKLLSLLKPGDFDFFISHFYEPEGYFNYYSLYTSDTKYEKKLSLPAGRYNLAFRAIGDQAPELSDPLPTMRVCIDQDCSSVDVANSVRGNWVEYTTRAYDVKAGSHNISLVLADDYWNQKSRQDKNIFVADTNLVDSRGERIGLEFVDSKAWTYSFLASNLATEDTIKEIRSLMKQNGLNMPIYITEYGWSYGTEAYPEWGKQFDWRSTLFDVLHIQSLIKEAIPQANIWKDLSTGYWKYFSNDTKGQTYWPIFSVFKLLSEKTGNMLVETKIENMPTYDARKIKFTATDRVNIPYLSVISSKKGGRAYINVVNRSQDSALLATIRTNPNYSSVTVSEIAPSSMEAHPYRDDQYKEEITTQEKTMALNGDFEYSFNPFSVTTFAFDAANSTSAVNRPAVVVLAEAVKTSARTAISANPNTCAISPEAGNYFKKTEIAIACGKAVSTANYQWDKGPVYKFSGEVTTVFTADKKRTLNLIYQYQTSAGGKKIIKTVKISKMYDANQRYCTVIPNGGTFTKDADVRIECGSGVKRSTWRWGNGPAYNFSPSTDIKFIADFSKNLNLSFAFDQLNGAKSEERVARFSKSFKVPQCIDSDKGRNNQLKGNLLYTGNTIKRSYADSCVDKMLTEYYCDKNNMMAFVKVRCPGSCVDGRCVE